MSGPSSLPERNQPAPGVPLPPLSPVRPEHKTLVLSWMWFSEQATKDTNDPALLSLLKNSAPQIASELLKLQYQLDVTAEAIQVYYDQARKNAGEMAGVDWNEVTVGKVVRSQRAEALMYGELKSALDDYDIKNPDLMEMENFHAVIQLIEGRGKRGLDLLRYYGEMGDPRQIVNFSKLDPKLEGTYTFPSVSHHS